MATSRIRLDTEYNNEPESQATAEADEAARWEAYCALQARKRRNGWQSPSDRDAAFNSPQAFPADTWGGDFARKARPSTFDEPRVSSDPPAFAAETAMPRLHGARRVALPLVALILAAGGILVTGGLLLHVPSGFQTKVRATRPAVAIDVRSAPPSAPMSQSTAPTTGPIVASIAAPRNAEINSRRTPAHRAGVKASHPQIGTKLGGREIVWRGRPVLHPRWAHTVQPVTSLTRRFADKGPAITSTVLGRKSIHPTPDLQRKEPVAGEHQIVRNVTTPGAIRPDVHPKADVPERETSAAERPGASSRLADYRASQAEYERQLKSYEHAMARYSARSGAEPPPLPRHASDPASALDSLSWRR